MYKLEMEQKELLVCPSRFGKIEFDFRKTQAFGHHTYKGIELAFEIKFSSCRHCHKPLVFLITGTAGMSIQTNFSIETEIEEKQIFPVSKFKVVGDFIPQEYSEDYLEAKTLVGQSPKASAALCRGILQNILRQEFEIEGKTLSDEIDVFLEIAGIPSYLAKAVDAIRNIGNFAAHPTKDTNTGKIVPVEKGEAEWSIEIVEALFDFCFIQPEILRKRSEELDLKLNSAGKPNMKKK